MTDYIKKFEFEVKPKQISYNAGEPLKLNSEFRFYHNKHKIRKELSALQYLFQDYIKNPLLATGIRDSYVKADYTENYLFVVLATAKTIKNTNEIIEEFVSKDLGNNCYYIKTDEDSLLIFAKNSGGITAGIQQTISILKQVLESYFERKQFDEFIKIPQFLLYDCKNK
ncbi:MAG: hypothetical protein P8Y70_03430 [Candidatus Lokiarchaeota archaeon]